MRRLPGRRRFATMAALSGTLIAGSACDPPPEPSDNVEVSYLTDADGDLMRRPQHLSERGEVLACQSGGKCYVWQDDDVSVIGSGDANFVAADMSKDGHVVGRVTEDEVTRPFSWQDGEVTILPGFTGEVPDDFASWDLRNVASQVNDNGLVAGNAIVVSPLGPWVPSFPVGVMAWRDGQLVTMPERDHDAVFLRVLGISDRNQVALNGYWLDPENFTAAIWDVDGDEVIDVGTLGGGWSRATDINGQGMVIGQSETADGEEHAFFWHNGDMTDLGTLGGGWSRATDINGQGMVIGQSETADGEERAFFWHDGDMTDLGTLGGSSTPQSFNEWGQVVGVSHNPDGEERAFLWHDGNMTDLGIDVAASDELSGAVDINNWGQVVVNVDVAWHDSDGTIIPPPRSRVYLWQNGRATDLADLLPDDWDGADYYWDTQALSINDRGQILGETTEGVLLGNTGILWEVSPTWGYYPDGLSPR